MVNKLRLVGFSTLNTANVDSLVITAAANGLELLPWSEVVRKLPNEILEWMRLEILEGQRLKGSRSVRHVYADLSESPQRLIRSA